MKPNPSPTSAFSLMELLVVAAILMILAVFAVPALPGLMGAKGLGRAVTDVSYLFELARTEAVARSSFVFLGFEDTTNSSGAFELRLAAAASPDGSSTTGLIPISRTVRLPNVRMADLGELPASVQSAANSTVTNSLFVNQITTSGISFTNGQQVFNKNILVISPEGELLQTPDATAFLASASVGLIETKGSVISKTDGAIVTFDGGSGAATIVRP